MTNYDPITLAYLAGCMDSDGSFGIRKSTYHMRVRKDASNAVYSERASLKQVTPEVPYFLKETFGGHVGYGKPAAENRKPFWIYDSTNVVTATIAKELLPYLRVKKRQAELLLELRESKQRGYGKLAYWFEREYPNWREMELVGHEEARRLLGYAGMAMVTQAIRNGTLLALPYNYRTSIARIPRLLIERVGTVLGKDGRARKMPPELIAWRQRLREEIRELNKTGINGTSIYRREGVYAMRE